METGRGKKVKKAAWHLNLGLKDVILAGIGVVGLMSMSFTLGALAGRGDIYRAAYSWGLLNPEAKPTAQVMPQAAVPPTPPLAGATAAPAATAVAPTPAAPPAAPAPPNIASLPGGPAAKHEAAAPTGKAKAAHATPIAGTMAPLPPPAAALSSKKSAKAAQAAQAQREQKAREDQLHHERQEVAKKLTFLNSFDSTSKPGQKKDKTSAKTPPTQVKVGTYRDSKTAQAKMAELQKKGVKVSLKQGKDNKGVCYTLYRQNPAAHPKEDNLVQKKEKAGSPGPSRKPQSE